MRRNRQRIRKIPLKSTISEGFWSEWGDSNARSLEPKSSAIPTSLHPDIHFPAMIPRRGVKIKFFLSVVIPVVKAAFVPLSAIGENPANAGVARLCGVLPCPTPDTATALPNHPRYQLRYTRIFSFCHYTTARGEKQSFFSLRSFMCTIHIGQVNKKAMRDMVSCDKAELPHQLIRKRDHIPHGQENNTGHGISAIPDEEHGNYGFGFASLFIPIILRSGRPSAGPPGRCAPR